LVFIQHEFQVKKNIAIFASGNGTNAECITSYFKNSKLIRVKLIVSNKTNAGVLERAKRLGVESFVLNREMFYHGNDVLQKLESDKIDIIALAGFLWLVPDNILKKFQNRIINIHPALLPKYGGKGMYGHHVHEAVIANREKKSGITIHYVNDKYDEGQVISQKEIEVLSDDTPESLAERIHQLEYEYYPKVIEEIMMGH